MKVYKNRKKIVNNPLLILCFCSRPETHAVGFYSPGRFPFEPKRHRNDIETRNYSGTPGSINSRFALSSPSPGKLEGRGFPSMSKY